MEPLNNKAAFNPKWLVFIGLILLSLGLLFGLTGALQYIIPTLFKNYLSFEKVRPLHVSSVVFWIMTGATGAVLSYLDERFGQTKNSATLGKIQLLLFIGSMFTALLLYCFGFFGGREYWEFPPILILPILAGWILFIINVFTHIENWRQQPVYIWMWCTGAIFFLFTLSESYLWVIPYFRKNVINDMTVQWKSYGSMVGAWNMLIYGSSIYLMEKISGDHKHGQSKTAFILYFAGLTNLMFNWGHHIYTLPTAHYIKHVSYIISMSELFIFAHIVWQWRSTLATINKYKNILAYQLLSSADLWVFLTLLLAILMSIPAINVYTHGTHITVAHAMGSTIGINTFLLLAFAVDLISTKSNKHQTAIKRGIIVANIGLFVFWISFIIAGILKAKWQMSSNKANFSEMMEQLKPIFKTIFVSGIVLVTGLFFIIIPLLRKFYQTTCCKPKTN
ncbi:MAG: hypothetical protein RLY16_1504 [Bacteroidota bacterium]